MAILHGFVGILTILCIGVLDAKILLDSPQNFQFENYVEFLGSDQQTYKSELKFSGQLKICPLRENDGSHLYKFDVKTLKIQNDENKNSIQVPDLNSFYVLITDNGALDGFYTMEENVSNVNFQKAIAALFAYSPENEVATESNVSGECRVSYDKLSATITMKMISGCSGWKAILHRRFEDMLDVDTKISQNNKYQFDESGKLLRVTSIQEICLRVAMTENLSVQAKSNVLLRHSETENSDNICNDEKLSDDLLENLKKDLMGGKVANIQKKKAKTLNEALELYRDKLSNSDTFGEDHSQVFIELIPVIRRASTNAIVAALKSPKNKDIVPHLVNLLGIGQTDAGYDAMMIVFNLNSDKDFSTLERYMQSLATGVRASDYIVRKSLDELQSNEIKDELLGETVYLSVCSMCRQLRHKLKKQTENLYNEVKSHLLSGLEKCSTNQCKTTFIRCLQNLRDPSVIPTLLEIASSDVQSAAVVAMKALRTFSSKEFTKTHKKLLMDVFYQSVRKVDSSVRTLALDILLEENITKSQLNELIGFLSKKGEPYEIKTYLLQRLNMLLESSPKFKHLVNMTAMISKISSNYDLSNQKGLSTVLQRKYYENPLLNGSLISSQEIDRGILKRGLVEFSLQRDDEKFNIFTLGLYTSGLSSFVGDDSTDHPLDDDINEEESAKAGMEISVLENQMRPLTLFDGQSELMGHIWSGTASSPLSAYQSNVLIHDHERYFVLNSGATVHFQLMSVNSIDLFGQAELSLWNRQAHTQIEKFSAWTIEGKTSVSIFSKELHYNVAANIQPSVDLIADIDFYSTPKLCLQLKRKSNDIRRQSSVLRLIDNVDTKRNTTLVLQHTSPGFTMALNRKNTEMCNIILQ